MAKTAFLFPGQGAQHVGMAADFIAAFPLVADLFDKANEIVGYDLKKICLEGPDDKLNATTVSQPAIFTMSAAIFELMKSDSTTAGITPDVTAGLSLGEYSALYAAGLVDFEDGLKLVQKRGNAMQTAADSTDGSMVSLLGLDKEKVAQLCEQAAEGQLLSGVNYNCPGQIVISGDIDACKRAVELADQYGAIKAIPLSVAGAFHTSKMAPAAKELQQALADCRINNPAAVQVIANINADYYTDAEAIRAGLVKQLVEPILWQACMERLLADGVESFYEIGPARVLTGLMRRINRKIKVVNISSVDTFEKLKA